VHVCVEHVVVGTQSCQNHLAGPVKKVNNSTPDALFTALSYLHSRTLNALADVDIE